jgi:hypothetical protein
LRAVRFFSVGLFFIVAPGGWVTYRLSEGAHSRRAPQGGALNGASPFVSETASHPHFRRAICLDLGMPTGLVSRLR